MSGSDDVARQNLLLIEASQIFLVDRSGINTAVTKSGSQEVVSGERAK